jgi:hypothetical protein
MNIKKFFLNIFKDSEYDVLSKKIKYKNYQIIDKLNKIEIEKLSKLNEDNRDNRIKEIIKNLSGKISRSPFGYHFNFEKIPMFYYTLCISGNNYSLGIFGVDDYFGFKCDYLLNENVFRLTLKSKEEIDDDDAVFKNLIKKVPQVALEIIEENNKNFEVTQKAKKLHSRMISDDYLNEFSYNQYKNNPISVI